MKKTLIFLIFLLLVSDLFSQQKYALVIGNSNYTGIPTLKNPVNDANAMEAALNSLGFAEVIKVLNGDQPQMLAAIANYKRKLGSSPNTYGFFYFAGHGVQVNGVNYLIPVHAENITSPETLRSYSVPLKQIIDELSGAGNELNMFVIDACRNFPFSWNPGGDRSFSAVAERGLVRVTHPSGSIVMYAAAEGQTADDGTGANGLFTSQLLNHLKTPGLSVYEMFTNTMGDVINMTNGRQAPELSLQYSKAHQVYLGSRLVDPTPKPSPPQMVRISGGTFQMGSSVLETWHSDNEERHKVTVSSFYMGKYEVTQKEYQEIMGTNPSYFKEDNLPVEKVSWFDAINYCNALSQKSGLTPVYTVNGTNVTWNYNANGYRLPTEAEWEYACRAGTTTAYNTGNNITTNQANYNGIPYNNNGTNREKTTAAGYFSPNRWGLYDMHGNVKEWCWDWYGDYSKGNQSNPRGASSGTNRVFRGGSWEDSESSVRSAYRGDWYPPGITSPYLGFRVARNG